MVYKNNHLIYYFLINLDKLTKNIIYCVDYVISKGTEF